MKLIATQFDSRSQALKRVLWLVSAIIMDTLILMNMSNQQLYEKCRFYGRAALEARRKFIGLLPEVARRRLWQEKGFESLYHFAAVLAGVSRQQVDDVINAEKRLVEFPLVRQKLTEGACSANKIIRTLSILKPDNEKFVAEKVLPMTKSTIEQWVRDEKQKFLPGQESDNRAGLLQEGPELKPEIRQKLTEMQNKGIDINQLIQNMLENYEKQIEAGENEEIEAKSRHVPVRAKRIIEMKYGTRCGKENCDKPAVHIHHTKLFAIHKNHSPKYLKPLCKAHHDLEHLTDERVMVYKRL